MLRKPLYTVNDFLSEFSVSRWTFYRLVNSGELKAKKMGSRTVVTAADAQAWLDSLPGRDPQAEANAA
ncbi:helix-turn-helix transcriptional regulator [Pelagibacterium luteolum]|uniref:DNA binding domain-containing protein, excisionase family n=1 Tax=Pelagibacterium luteolum TaxID=440168 RepID=A0A1G7S723_9HYPH|nr:helix-turn-helix domain-containing protein [Pelagibacterium luteolum]SDG18744.1 DNA binding domain-containing protein, excisionase family [Pelagibacterium luteolum]